MKPNNDQSCDVATMQHKAQMAIICFVGVIAVLGMMFCGIALAVVLWNNDQKELAVITALISTIGNAISLCIGVLIPSPVQGSRSRANDSVPSGPDATGKAGDPVHIAPETPSDDVSKSTGLVLPEHPSEAEFEATNPIPRGVEDNLDASYTDESESENQNAQSK